MPFVQLSDTKLYYEERGDGFPLVLIAGFTSNVHSWEKSFLNKLAEKFRVIVFDNRGAGRSERKQEEYSIKGFANDTVALMDAINIERAHILGVSMGGMIAQEIAIHDPNRVSKLILACTDCGRSKKINPSEEILHYLVSREGTPEEIKKQRMKTMFPNRFAEENKDVIDDWWQRASIMPINDAENIKNRSRAVAKFDSYDRLGQIKAPTYIISGTEDVLIPPGNSKILAEAIPHSTLEFFEGGGHGFITQYPKHVGQKINQFLLGE